MEETEFVICVHYLNSDYICYNKLTGNVIQYFIC